MKEIDFGGRLIGEGFGHKVPEDRYGSTRSLLPWTKCAWLVKSNVNANRQVWGESNKPSVLGLVRRSRLAGKWLADGFDPYARATLNNAMKHGHHLVGRRRIDDLLTVVRNIWLILMTPTHCDLTVGARPRIMPHDRPSAAILNPVNQ